MMNEDITGMEPVFFHRYVLRSGVALNSASMRREFHGALIRAHDGFACIHPWPEFGDLPIDEQLEALAQGETTPQSAMALRCARLDGEARREGRSLFEGLEVPRSHYSWSFSHETEPQLRRVLEEGWPAIKAKGFANWGESLRFLECVARATDHAGTMLRLDFNGCLDRFGFVKFCEHMPLRVYRQMDLIEDPLPYDAKEWQRSRERWGVKLALDKGWREGTEGFDAVVVKPARRDWRAVAARFPDHPLVLTSAMDHPLGQAWAAYEAALVLRERPEKTNLCGLCTEHLFDRDEFLEATRSHGGHLEVDRAGTGLGFDHLLEALPWKRLS
jgi:O-succinylbenzoate synthase